MGVSNIMLQAGAMPEVVDSIVNNIGIDMFDEEIDDVIFQTNEFLTDATFIGASGPFWWLPLPILQNTILVAVNQSFINSCLVTQNQRGTKTVQNHGKIKSRTLCPKYPLWNTSVSFAKVQICPLKNEGEIPISLIHNSFSYHCTPNVVIANGFDLKRLGLRKSGVKFCFALCWTFSKTRTGNRTKDLPPLLSNPWFGECLNDRHLKMLNFK